MARDRSPMTATVKSCTYDKNGVATVTVIVQPAPVGKAPPVTNPQPTGEQAQRFYAPSVVFNQPVPASPPSAAQVQWSSVAVKPTDGWPVNYASATDTQIHITATGNGQQVTCRCPKGVT